MSTLAVAAVKTLVDALLAQLGLAANGPGTLREGMVDTTSDTRVAQLHADLREVGFHLAPAQSGRFDQYTRWAVRDFQSYAKFAVVAQTSTPFGYLAEPATAVDTVLVVDDPTPFELLSVPFVVRVGTEDIEVSERTTSSGVPRENWNVSRARHGTGATLQLAGEGVTHLPEPRYSSTLTSVPVPAADRYAGPVSGVVNQRTADLIQLWKQRRYRCPVVVEAWTVAGGAPTEIAVIPATEPGEVPIREARLADNIWRPEEITTLPRVFVRDFSDYWQPRPPEHPVDGSHRDAMTILGSLVNWHDGDDPLTGPGTGPDTKLFGFSSWPAAEVLPEALLGSSLATLVSDIAAQQVGALGRLSTFKVVRAVAEVECLGYFDAAQGYDIAFLSRGLCHWTAGARIRPKPTTGPSHPPPREMWNVSDGEFWAFLAFLRDRFPRADDQIGSAYEQIATHWGLGVTRAWTGNGQQRGGPWLPGERKYAGRATLTTESGAAQELTGFAATGPGAQPYGQYGDHEMFRLWHVFYRFVMAGRTSAALRRAEWTFARTRIRDVLNTPWGQPAERFNLPAATTIGDVFTSERTVAMLYRWHILAPGTLIEPDGAGSARASTTVHGVVTKAAAQLRTGPPPATRAFGENTRAWGNPEEKALHQQILDLPKTVKGMKDTKELKRSLREAASWPSWRAASNPRHYALPLTDLPTGQRSLSLARDSFTLDGRDLP